MNFTNCLLSSQTLSFSNEYKPAMIYLLFGYGYNRNKEIKLRGTKILFSLKLKYSTLNTQHSTLIKPSTLNPKPNYNSP